MTETSINQLVSAPEPGSATVSFAATATSQTGSLLCPAFTDCKTKCQYMNSIMQTYTKQANDLHTKQFLVLLKLLKIAASKLLQSQTTYVTTAKDIEKRQRQCFCQLKTDYDKEKANAKDLMGMSYSTVFEAAQTVCAAHKMKGQYKPCAISKKQERFCNHWTPLLTYGSKNHIAVVQPFCDPFPQSESKKSCADKPTSDYVKQHPPVGVDANTWNHTGFACTFHQATNEPNKFESEGYNVEHFFKSTCEHESQPGCIQPECPHNSNRPLKCKPNAKLWNVGSKDKLDGTVRENGHFLADARLSPVCPADKWVNEGKSSSVQCYEVDLEMKYFQKVHTTDGCVDGKRNAVFEFKCSNCGGPCYILANTCYAETTMDTKIWVANTTSLEDLACGDDVNNDDVTGSCETDLHPDMATSIKFTATGGPAWIQESNFCKKKPQLCKIKPELVPVWNWTSVEDKCKTGKTDQPWIPQCNPWQAEDRGFTITNFGRNSIHSNCFGDSTTINDPCTTINHKIEEDDTAYLVVANWDTDVSTGKFKICNRLSTVPGANSEKLHFKEP
jgi:hypothetical protein